MQHDSLWPCRVHFSGSLHSIRLIIWCMGRTQISTQLKSKQVPSKHIYGWTPVDTLHSYQQDTKSVIHILIYQQVIGLIREHWDTVHYQQMSNHPVPVWDGKNSPGNRDTREGSEGPDTSGQHPLPQQLHEVKTINHQKCGSLTKGVFSSPLADTLIGWFTWSYVRRRCCVPNLVKLQQTFQKYWYLHYPILYIFPRDYHHTHIYMYVYHISHSRASEHFHVYWGRASLGDIVHGTWLLQRDRRPGAESLIQQVKRMSPRSVGRRLHVVTEYDRLPLTSRPLGRKRASRLKWQVIVVPSFVILHLASSALVPIFHPRRHVVSIPLSE